MSIFESLPMYIGALANQTGIKVKIGGNSAEVGRYGSTWHIKLPYIDTKNVELAALSYGYALHETGHILYTDFDFRNEWIKGVSAKTNTLRNIFEDMYIERQLRRKLKGSHDRLSKVRSHLTKRGDELNLDELTTAKLIDLVIYFYGFSVNGYDKVYYKQFEDFKTELDARIEPAFTAVLMGIVGNSRYTQSTKDCAVLAEEVMQYIEDYLDEQANKSNDANSSDDDTDSDSDDANGSDDDSDDANGSDDDSDDANGSDDDSDDANGSDDDSDGAEGSQGDTGDADSSNDSGDINGLKSALREFLDDESGDLEDSLEKALKAEIEAEKEGDDNEPDPREVSYNPSVLPAPIQNQNFAHADSIQKNARKESLFLAQRLHGLVESKAQLQLDRRSSGRRLINNAGLRLMQNDMRVFKHESQVDMPNTAVTLLLDQSNSMCGKAYQTSVESTYALVEALSKINLVKTSVLGFGNSTESVIALKGFEETPAKCLTKLASSSADGYCTPLATGLWAALNQLYTRTEDRKVVLVVTDGQPHGFQYCKNLIAEMQASNVEVYGIGIGNDLNLPTLQSLFGKQFAIKVDQLSDLGNEVFKIAEGILLD
uniref:von Willebrand factor type A n=1 Tax=Shewanella putrefaciens (strain 200) TaxID=399804 RepID=E6XGZ2_SHEP2